MCNNTHYIVPEQVQEARLQEWEDYLSQVKHKTKSYWDLPVGNDRAKVSHHMTVTWLPQEDHMIRLVFTHRRESSVTSSGMAFPFSTGHRCGPGEPSTSQPLLVVAVNFQFQVASTHTPLCMTCVHDCITGLHHSITSFNYIIQFYVTLPVWCTGR